MANIIKWIMLMYDNGHIFLSHQDLILIQIMWIKNQELMKIILFSLQFIFLSMCQEPYNPKTPIGSNNKSEELNTSYNDSSETNNTKIPVEDRLYNKQLQVLSISDYSLQQTGIVTSKAFHIVEDLYELNYRYPYLDDEAYTVFNAYIFNEYLNIEKTVNEILDDKEIQCNNFKGYCKKDIKFLDFKIYSLQEALLSVLLYQENYYAGVAHSSYSFDCLNFDLDKNKFIRFNDLFTKEASSFIFKKINATISKGLQTGALYYECWELTHNDFETYKDNFVVNDQHFRFYFDDCIICPSFTGTYYVEIPINEVLPFINIYNKNPLL